MAFLECRFFSESLQLSCAMNVILPQATRAQIGMKGKTRGKKHPVLWLLHGMSDDHTIWARRTSIERYASETGLAVVMPAANLSWYQNMASGPAYRTFIADELPELARSFFPLSDRPRDNFIAGLSMGGYGAFLLALSHPDRYAAAASLSGALDPTRLAKVDDPHRRAVFRAAFGSVTKFRGGDSDVFHLASLLAKSKGPKPKLYACCGDSDFLLSANRDFLEHANKIGLALRYEQHPGASHTWDYWDRQIEEVIRWLPLPDPT